LSLGTTQNCSACGDVCSGERPYCLSGACSEVNATPCASFPVPAKNTWAVSAYRTSQYTSEPPSLAIDGNTNTRYANGGDMNANDWIQIDFGKKVAITQTQVVHDNTDYARGYALLMTDSPPNQSTAAEVSGSNSNTTMTVNSLLAGRYLRIRQTGSAAQWWSIKEIHVSCSGP